MKILTSTDATNSNIVISDLHFSVCKIILNSFSCEPLWGENIKTRGLAGVTAQPFHCYHARQTKAM